MGWVPAETIQLRRTLYRIPNMQSSKALALLGFALSTSAFLAAQTVTVRVPGCAEPIHRYAFNGVNFTKVADLADADGAYELPNDVTRTQVVYVGPASGGQIPIVLDGKESFTITGNCKSLNKAIITGSPANDEYNAVKQEMAALKQESQSLTQKLGLAPQDTPAGEQALADLKANDAKRIARLEELQAGEDDFLASVWAADLYTSFANDQKGYGNELEYFANERFQYADFSLPSFGNNPWVFESFREVTKVLLQSGLPAEAAAQYLQGYLALAVNYPEVHKLALGGIVATLRQQQSPVAGAFAKQYLDTYGATEPAAAKVLAGEVERLSAFSGETAAPEFTQELLTGGTAGPQDYRGKILLIDFWASWCGPCRRENPNVVRMYNEFKDDGFEILGVSLDKNRGSWEGAVEKDGLTWPHVSDLRGWSNEAARQYGVSSIPATFLLDREGKIVARNLRGEALHAKVAELVAQP